MFSLFAHLRPFAVFRAPPGRVLTAPKVALDEDGAATVVCRTIPAPRLVIDEAGKSTVSCANG